MGWEEDFLQEAVDTCTNESGRIQDCPLFNIIEESEARECEMKTPLQLLAEQVLEGLKILPGDVEITFDENSTPAKPSSSSSPGGLLGGIFKESSTSATPTTTSEVAAAVAPPPPPTTTSSPPPPPPPTTTSPPPPPSPTPTIDPNVSYESTQYITNGDIVTKILWDEEIVWVTEMVDATTTKIIQGGPPPTSVPEPAPKRRRDAHLHAHNHHHL